MTTHRIRYRKSTVSVALTDKEPPLCDQFSIVLLQAPMSLNIYSRSDYTIMSGVDAKSIAEQWDTPLGQTVQQELQVPLLFRPYPDLSVL
jgi:hypothetical protein